MTDAKEAADTANGTFPAEDAAGQTVAAITQAGTISAGKSSWRSTIRAELTSIQMRLPSTTARSGCGESKLKKSMPCLPIALARR